MSNSSGAQNRFQGDFSPRMQSFGSLRKPSCLDQIKESYSQRASGESTEAEDSNKEDEIGIQFTPEHTLTPTLDPIRTKLPPILSDSPAVKARTKPPYDQLQNFQNNLIFSNSRLHRIYSETETSNFNSFNGRRMYDDDRYRPHKVRQGDVQSPTLRHFSTTKLNTPSRSFSQYEAAPNSLKRSHYTMDTGITGMEDEYIPDFDFSMAIQQWTSDSQVNLHKDYDSSFDSSFNDSIPSSAANSIPSTPIGKLHAQVEPVSVPVPKRDHYKTDLTNEEEELISKLPENFVDLPFSVRRKMLVDIAPNGNTDAISKIIKKKFKRKPKNSPAVQFLNSFSDKSSVKLTDEGSVILNHKLGRIIGFGAWGIIRECRSTINNEINAIKVIHAKTDAVKKFFKREATIWHELHHPHILPLLNIQEDPKCIFCLMVKANGGTMYDLVSKWGLYDSETSPPDRLKLIKTYALQIISALQYMHSKGFVHGDVKLENVLIHNTINETKVYVCDFGMSLKFMDISPDYDEEISLPNNALVKRRPSIPRSSSGTRIVPLKSSTLQRIVIDKHKTHDDTKLSLHEISSPRSPNESNTNEIVFNSKFKFEYPEKDFDEKNDDPNIPHSHIGSLPYASPELLESSPPPLGPSADIWAFGVLLYTSVVGKLPFQHQYEPRLRAMISAGKYDMESLELAAENDKNLINAVKGCLITDLNKRVNFEVVNNLIKSSLQ